MAKLPNRANNNHSSHVRRSESIARGNIRKDKRVKTQALACSNNKIRGYTAWQLAKARRAELRGSATEANKIVLRLAN